MKLTEQFKYRLKELAGIVELDSKSPQHIALKKGKGQRKPFPQPQPTGSIVGCTQPNALNYNPEATVACTAGDADWFADNPQIGAASFPNECCEYSCEHPMNFNAFGGECSEVWMSVYCEEDSNWSGVGLATSFVTMCNACPCVSYACTPCNGCQPSTTGPYNSLEECQSSEEGGCAPININDFEFPAGGFPTVEEFCGRCEVAYQQTQAWGLQNGLPDCDCCSQVDITNYLDNVCQDGFCYNPDYTGTSDMCIPC